MTDDIRFTPLVRSLPATVPFVGPETLERQRGQVFDARLGANESVFGPSPAVLEALAEGGKGIWMYGDPTAFELKGALATHFGIKRENIVVGAGIDGLLDSTVRLFVTHGDAVVTSDGAYPTFNYHVVGYGGTLTKVPFRDDHEDLDALLEAAQRLKPKLIYLSNPDNPMGTWHSATKVLSFADALPRETVLVLDEAYSEFAPADALPPLDMSNRRIIRMRTFSKAYGMAGARVGFALGHPDLVGAYDKVRNHFGMNRSALLGARAALADQAYLQSVIDRVAAARDRIGEIAKAHGLDPIPSATNFVAIDCKRDGAFARAVLQGLIERGVFVRMPFVAPEDRCIRVSAGTPEMLYAFAAALPGALKDVEAACQK
ncbi:MAG: pyridoxal phosphate-dependent aminotransferase [Marinovum sp.]|nr:pyridoxal phosphate-dependent aminotransferase [Marinovum sp.]